MKEIVDAEYVLMEVNGLFTYSYSLTADSAHCRSQPQNWSSMKQEKPSFTFTTWNREVSLFPKRQPVTHYGSRRDEWAPPALCPELPGTLDSGAEFGIRG
jgi:hypothetical protein